MPYSIMFQLELFSLLLVNIISLEREKPKRRKRGETPGEEGGVEERKNRKKRR